MDSITEYIKDNQGFKFFIRKWMPQSASKGIILLLHGLSDHSNRFVHVAEAFAQEGFIFFAPDLRGNGNSKGRRGYYKSIDVALNDVDFFIAQCQQQFPHLPIFIYAQSMGGNLALNYLINYPNSIKGAVISSPWLKLTNPPSRLTSFFGKILAKFTPWYLKKNGITGSQLTHNESIANSYDNDPFIHGKIALKTYFIITKAGKTVIERAAELKTPTLILHSQNDPIASYSASESFFKQSNENAEFRSFSGLLHELHNETQRPDILKGIVQWVLSHS